MNRSKFTRVLAMVLSIVMVAGLLPMTTFAADADASMSLTIASTKTPALAPGVQEQEVVAYDANGDRIVYYAIEANVATNSDVQVKANYHDNDNTGVWGKATVVEQANAAAAAAAPRAPPLFAPSFPSGRASFLASTSALLAESISALSSD